MKKILTRTGYGLATVLMMALMIILTGTETSADGYQTNITVHVGSTFTKIYTVDAPSATFTSQNTAVVAVTSAAVTVSGTAAGFSNTEVSYIAVTPGAASVILSARGLQQTIFVTVQDHVFSTEYTADKPATCTEEGVESIHCSVCGAIKPGSERTIPLAPHTWGTIPVTDEEPTYFSEGSESYHCTVCDAIDESSVTTIPKLRLGRAKIKKLVNNKPKTTNLTIKKIVGPNGFKLRYGTKKNFKKATTKSIKTRKVKFKNLTVGKTYYFKVRAVLKEDGKKAYGPWSKTVSIRITQ